MSAIDAWRETKRAMEANGLTVHNLGDDIWEVADQMYAALSAMEADEARFTCPNCIYYEPFLADGSGVFCCFTNTSKMDLLPCAEWNPTTDADAEDTPKPT